MSGTSAWRQGDASRRYAMSEGVSRLTPPPDEGPYTGETGTESKGTPADVRVLRQPSRQPGSQPGMNGRHGLTQPMKSPTGAVGAGQKGLEGTVRWQPRPSNDTQCELRGMVGNYRVSHLKVGEPRLGQHIQPGGLLSAHLKVGETPRHGNLAAA